MKNSAENFPTDKESINDLLHLFMDSPLLKYFTLGISAAILMRWSKSLNRKFPEVSDFIKENSLLLDKKVEAYKRVIQNHTTTNNLN